MSTAPPPWTVAAQESVSAALIAGAAVLAVAILLRATAASEEPGLAEAPQEGCRLIVGVSVLRVAQAWAGRDSGFRWSAGTH